MKTLLALVAVPVIALAQNGRNGRPPQPPPEAFAACSSAKEGDACTVVLRDRDVDGTCATFADGRRACRPNHPPPPPPDDGDQR